MVGYEKLLFSELVDLNWELEKGEQYSSLVRKCILERFLKVKEMLEKEMGRGEFDKFMNLGKEMFKS